jgi:hypothetical protein
MSTGVLHEARADGTTAPAAPACGARPPRINVVKVFSASRARERAELATRITAWLRANPRRTIAKVDVMSSDVSFHCLSIVIFGSEALE